MGTSKSDHQLPAFDSPAVIRTDWLETFEYQGPRQKIQYCSKEFSAVCPYSGLPDVAELSIHYIPSKLVLELKSLKYYLVSFRNVGIFQEPATARIYEDMFALLKPQRLLVKTRYNTRGGIDALCEICSEQQANPSPASETISHGR